MKKFAYYALLVVLIGVFLFSAYKLGDYFLAKYRSDAILNEASKFVTVEEKEPDKKEAPERVQVDFDRLWERNEDIVAWIYCKDTKLNYPIVQGNDNEYYLYRLLDESWNYNGTIFMDYRNDPQFTDPNTLIYGHHMQTGAMFGDLVKYMEQEYYDEHPCIYLTTPDQEYRMNLLAGCIVKHNDGIFVTDFDTDKVADYMADSTFVSKSEYKGGPIVTLSTCTYEFENARYVVLGELVPVEKETK